jgi:2'-5' RNA ligase
VVTGIAERLAEHELSALDLQLDGIGTFKRRRLVRVVWMGLESGLKEARALAARVDDECVMAGLAAESRPFRAHLTLARGRARHDAELPSLPSAPRIAPWRATELVLYSSHLSRTGSIYEDLRRVPLR